MANYSINVTDNGDGSWTLTNVYRAPGQKASGANTSAGGSQVLGPTRSGGDAVGTTTGWTYQGTLGQVFYDAGVICAADLAKNGN